MLVGKCIWWGTWDSPTLPLTFHPGGMCLTCQDAGHVLPSVLTAKNLMEITSPIQWMPIGLLLFPYNLKRLICIIFNEYLIKIYFYFLITTFRMWPPSYLKSCSKIGFIFFLSEKTGLETCPRQHRWWGTSQLLNPSVSESKEQDHHIWLWFFILKIYGDGSG